MVTNNCVEGWHRRCKAVMQCDKPGVFKCIAKLLKEQNSQSNQIERLNSDEPHKKKQKIYLDKRLKSIVTGRNQRTVMEFLRGIAHNLN